MSDLAYRTSICSVVFVDIVDYSKAAVDRQVAMKDDLNQAVRTGVANASEDELIVLDAGDGAAICFFGDPEDALFAATAISGALRGQLRLRTGINLGPVKIVTDLNGNRNVIGDAINVAQRIMSFANEHEVLISRPYFEIVSCLRDVNTFSFHPLGTRKDKHIREHEIYAVASATEPPEQTLLIEGPTDAPKHEHCAVETVGASAPDTPLSAEFIEHCRAHLARFLGPMAGVIVRRAPVDGVAPRDFVRFLSEKIDSPSERNAFIAAAGTGGGTVPQDKEAPPAPAASDPAPVDMQRPTLDLENEVTPGTVPLDTALISEAEVQLALIIGPMARPLTARAAAKASSPSAFVALLADHIDDEAARRRFIGKMKT